MGVMQTLAMSAASVASQGAGPDTLLTQTILGATLANNNDAFFASISGAVSAQNGGAGDTRTLVWTYGGQAIDTRVINGINAVCFYHIWLEVFRRTSVTAFVNTKFEAWNSGVDTAPVRSFEKGIVINVTHANDNILLLTGASSDAVAADLTRDSMAIAKYPA